MQTPFDKKLIQAREELKTLMNNWRKEWRDVMTEWSEKIFILRFTNCSGEAAILPTDSGTNYHLASSYQPLGKGRERSLEDAINYYNHHANKYLSIVPLNLAILVYRHLVIAFGDIFLSSPSPYDPNFYYHHFLWAGRESGYERHRKLIHESSLDSSNSLHPEMTFGEFKEEFDGWEKVAVLGFQMDDKLKASKYIKGVFQKLAAHQINKMIDYHFLNRETNSIDSAKKLVQRFELVVGTPNICIVVAAGDDFNFNILEGKNDREMMKKFDFENAKNSEAKSWQLVVRCQPFAKLVANLTNADVHFILSCFIDAEYDIIDTINTIKEIEFACLTTSISTSDPQQASFPGANDHFLNFDFPHLRGLLADGVLSRKLAAHATGLEAIHETRAGSFAAVAPAALVNIVAHYLPVNL